MNKRITPRQWRAVVIIGLFSAFICGSVFQMWLDAVREESEVCIIELFEGEVPEPAGIYQFRGNPIPESEKAAPKNGSGKKKPEATFSNGLCHKTFFGLDLDRIAKILIKVESDGKQWLVGDKHLTNKAYGLLQVRKTVLDDVNPILKTHYTADQMNGNKELSLKVWKVYIGLWATPKRLEHNPTTEEVARIWNGGPNGYKKSSTIPYVVKVRKVAHEQKADDLLALNK